MNAKDLKPSIENGVAATRRAGPLLALLVCFLVIVMDGFNTTSISFVVPKLAHEWHLAAALFTTVFVATNIGAAIGFMISGPLAQRFGHRYMGVASVVLFAGSTLLTSYANDIASLSVMRLAAAIGLGAALPIAITAAAGIIGAKHKVAASLLITTGMSVGAVTGGVTGGPLMSHFGWQSIFVTGGLLPFLLVPAFFRILPARTPAIADTAGVRASNPLKALFENGLGAYTCLLWLFSFLIFMDVYALLFWVPTLLVDFGFSADHASVGMAAFSIGGLSGNVLMTGAVAMMTLAGRIKVKSALVLGLLLVILSITGLSQAAVAPGIVLLLTGVIGAGLVNGIMGQTALAVAFYPPEIRATGVGWGHAIGRVGSFVGPAIGGGLLSLGWPVRDIVLTAVVPAGAAIFALAALSLIGRRVAQKFPDRAVVEH
ncbi:AAHS family 4-hydroxybenzoate transporter-like MFS transporter [Paraburkholderia sp. BL23I1N1]|uniref:MFS transporter n=1 Tax=Paraburkholderia sp. BL23I1N1 TaxID=1938802 RepID=UPI000FF19CD7|nr:MFS transporter [Paraburkholderia sp. BL23I1N1]RKE38394.1 AAHS family 4-hydroxybenzoate transporter-like MFS transporter [Paraburkholderia sp. BL23I1N1]